LPLLNSGRVELLDHKRLVAQLCGLERRTSRAGRDSIDHVPGGHDDIANGVAGAVAVAMQAAAAADEVPIPRLPEVTGSNSAGIPAHYLRQGNDWRPYGPLPDSIKTPTPSWLR
jgi:hypothetical protein